MSKSRKIESWISPAEAARRAGVSEKTIIRAADAGTVEAVKTSLGRLFNPDDIERWATERGAA